MLSHNYFGQFTWARNSHQFKILYSKAPKLFDYELLAPQNYQKSEDIPSSHTFLIILTYYYDASLTTHPVYR